MYLTVTHRGSRWRIEVGDLMPGGDEDPSGDKASVSHEGPSHIFCRSRQERDVHCLSVGDYENALLGILFYKYWLSLKTETQYVSLRILKSTIR